MTSFVTGDGERHDTLDAANMHASQVHAQTGNIIEVAAQITEPTLTSADCLDHRGDGCTGKVEYRTSLSPTGRSFPRCDGAWKERLEVQEQIERRYPQHQPADFDPSYAGESWDEDE